METITSEYARLRSAITQRLNAHGLLSVLPHGAPETSGAPGRFALSVAMTSGSGEDGKRYEWQSWPSDSLEGMPPKRRLAVWGLLWVMALNFVLRAVLSALGIPEPWLSLVFAAILAAVLVPLIWGAVTETRELRAQGVDMPTDAITRKSLIVFSVITGVLWTVFVILAVLGEFAFPLLPIACTVWLAFQARRWGSLPH